MRNILRIPIYLIIILLSTSVYAQDLTVKLEPGIAVPLTKPQSDRFNVGGAVAIKGVVGLTPAFDVSPSVSFMTLPSNVSGVNAGTFFGLGGGLRIKRPHDKVNNTGNGFSAVSPWVDNDLQYVRTGELNRFGWAVGTGVSVPTSNERSLWVGPFVRYQNVLQTEKIGFDSSDAKLLIAGLSFELGPVQKDKIKLTEPKTLPVKVEVTDRDHDGTPDATDRCPDVPGPKDNFGCPKSSTITVVETNFELQQKIQFDCNSSKINVSEYTTLDNVVKTLLAHKNYKVKIEGHASSDGQVKRNNFLAQKRAEAVLDYLVGKGISKKNLSAIGFGSKVPFASNSTKTGRVANRRVDFVVNFVIVSKD